MWSDAALDVAPFTTSLFWGFASSVGPFLAFALAGLFMFRRYHWALWCLVFLASAYTLLMLLGLLVEYGMAREAVEAAARGSRYMNCAGHPRLFIILFALPLTAGTLLTSGVVQAVEALYRAIKSQSLTKS